MTKLAVFASGSGSNFEAIAEACRSGRIKAEVALMVCDKPSAGVIARAGRYGVETFVFSPRDYASRDQWESIIADLLDSRGGELVCLAGYMRIVGRVLLERYRDRIINIHPSLLPSFKGAHAIADAMAYGVKVYGVTIHRVDETLDGGRIISQRAIDYDGDDADQLTEMIHAVEHELYIETINKLIDK